MTFSLLNPSAVIGGGVALLIVGLAVLAWWNKRERRALEESPEAVPCAACGSSVVLMKRWREQETMQRFCYNCGAMGQEGETRDEATMLWNRKQGDKQVGKALAFHSKQEAREGSEGLLSLQGADVIADEIEEGGR